jgi:hypothetical protein
VLSVTSCSRWLLLPAVLIHFSPETAIAEPGLAGSTWTLVASEQCQLGEIKKVVLNPDGTATATALLEDQGGGGLPVNAPEAADLNGTWSVSDANLHVSFGQDSLKLDGPVTGDRFTASATLMTDMNDQMTESCLLQRK